MRVYRIARKQYIRDLSGEGARLHGGRWNPKGRAVLYTSAHPSLAVLEMLVHASKMSLPPDLMLLELAVPDREPAVEISQEDLPQNWREYPAPSKLADIGKNWLDKKDCLALKVPSVIIPSEKNVLLNPAHQAFEQVNILNLSPFKIDARLEE